MASVDISKWEAHNLTKRGDELRTRRGLVSVKTPTVLTSYVGGFSVESPQTSEVWHYLFEQAAGGACTMRVMTEEFSELYSYALGPIAKDPVITWGVQNNQGIISSPSFSVPLYFVVGGGAIAMTKQASANPDTTALSIPRGHAASFGDRFVIAQGPIAYFNDPGTDPRSFVAENAVSLPGAVYDMFQAGDGALMFFTSAGIYSLPADALGQGQSVVGFLTKIPGLQTARARNAATSNGRVAVLQHDGVVTLDGAKLVAGAYKGRRYYSKAVDVEDLRQSGEIYSTSTGFIVGFRSSRGFFIDINLDDGFVSYVSVAGSSLNVVGTLRSRDGETLVVLKDRVVQSIGSADYSGTIRGVACGRLDIPEGRAPVVRRVTVSAANVGEMTGVFVNGATSTDTTPSKLNDVIIGTTPWSASTPMAGRAARTVRHSLAVRATDPGIEVFVDGGDRRVEAAIDVKLSGQGQTRMDQP